MSSSWTTTRSCAISSGATLDTMKGVSALAASTIEEAESALEQRQPDVILVDLDLAGADGAVVVGAARRRCPSAFVAVFTGDDPATRRPELRALGADVVVRKGPPDTIRVLVAAGRAKLEVAALDPADTPSEDDAWRQSADSRSSERRRGSPPPSSSGRARTRQRPLGRSACPVPRAGSHARPLLNGHAGRGGHS